MTARLGLRVRILLFFCLLAGGALALAGGALYVGWSRGAAPAESYLTAFILFGFLNTGLVLAVWAFVRRDGLTSAIVPTDLPMWLDRFTTSACLVGGVLLFGLAVRNLLRVSPPE